MTFKAFKKISQGDQDSRRQSEAIKEFLDQFNFSLIYGAFLNGGDYIDLSTTSESFAHRLDEKYKGFIVTELDAGESVFNTRNDQDDRFIELSATGDCKAKVWVF